MTSQQTGGLKPTRRTLVKGAAWSVPVVAMGQTVAAAQTACSPLSCPCLEIDWGANACKEPGNANPNNPKTFFIEITITNTCTTGDVTVTLQRIESNAGGYVLHVNETQVIGQGLTATFGVYQVQSTNSANFQNVYLLIGGQQYDVYPFQLSAPPDCRQATVPSVLGQTVDSAQLVLEGSGLTLGTVTYDGDADGSGTITAQDPVAGTTVATNTAVNVTVNGTDPDTTETTPDDLGETRDINEASTQQAPLQTEDTTVVEPAPEGEPAETQSVDPAATTAEPQNG